MAHKPILIYSIKIDDGQDPPWISPGTIYHTDLMGDGTFSTLDLNEAYRCREEIAHRDYTTTGHWRAIYTVEERR